MPRLAREVITVRGLTDEGASRAIETLYSLPGLRKVSVDIPRSRLDLEYEPRRYGVLTAVLLLRQQGLPAVLGEHG